MRPIDADALMEYCLNQKSRTVDCNDIARFQMLDVKPVVHGKWKDCGEREPWYRCSECKEKVWGGHRNYCPNCGADMREVGGEE